MVRQGMNFMQGRAFCIVLGDDPFSAFSVGDPMSFAEAIEKILALQTEAGLERCGAVVQAGMYDFRVSRRGLCAYCMVFLDEESRCGRYLG